jgi:hypothetical protein
MFRRREAGRRRSELNKDAMKQIFSCLPGFLIDFVGVEVTRLKLFIKTKNEPPHVGSYISSAYGAAFQSRFTG